MMERISEKETTSARSCIARSRPPTGRSTGARLYDLTEEEIGIVEAAAK
jgi:hypothetical protein